MQAGNLNGGFAGREKIEPENQENCRNTT